MGTIGIEWINSGCGFRLGARGVFPRLFRASDFSKPAAAVELQSRIKLLRN
jgi:hypothetical protein